MVSESFNIVFGPFLIKQEIFFYLKKDCKWFDVSFTNALKTFLLSIT